MQNIRITEAGVFLNQGSVTVSYDKNTSLLDYKPEVNSTSSWTGVLNKGDEITIQMSKFLFLRARGVDENPLGNSSCNITNFENYCSPAHNTLINSCGCCSNVGGSDTLLNFHLKSYTNFKLDSKTLFLTDESILDCTAGTTILEGLPLDGWESCEKLECVTCEENGTPLVNTITVQGSLSAECDVTKTTEIKGIYNYIFTGVLENYGLVIKSNSAENDYNCKDDYYAYVKNDNPRILVIFNNSKGTWNLLELDTDLTEIVENLTAFEVIESISLGTFEQTNKLNNTNIFLPPLNNFLISGEQNILNSEQVLKINNLFVLESDRFDGKIVCGSDNVKLSLSLSI